MALILRSDKDPGKDGDRSRKRILCLLSALPVLICMLYWAAKLRHDCAVGAGFQYYEQESSSDGGQSNAVAWRPARSQSSVDLPSASQPLAQSITHNELEKKYVISGRVFSSKRMPILGANVSLYARINDLWRGEDLVGAVSTDANGSYQLILDSPPKGDLIVNKPGYAEYLARCPSRILPIPGEISSWRKQNQPSADESPICKVRRLRAPWYAPRS